MAGKTKTKKGKIPRGFNVLFVGLLDVCKNPVQIRQGLAKGREQRKEKRNMPESQFKTKKILTQDGEKFEASFKMKWEGGERPPLSQDVLDEIFEEVSDHYYRAPPEDEPAGPPPPQMDLEDFTQGKGANGGQAGRVRMQAPPPPQLPAHKPADDGGEDDVEDAEFTEQGGE